MLRKLLLLLAVLLATTGVAHAQPSDADRATARALYVEGQKALAAGDFQAAADKFLRGESLFHAPTMLVGLARAYVGLGKYVGAMESYNKVIREELPEKAPKAFVTAVEEAKNEVVGLDEKIGWVTISVDGPSDPVVMLDDGEVSVASLGVKRAVNPGDHLVKVTAAGYLPAQQEFSIGAGATQEVALTLEAAPEGATESPGGGDGTGSAADGSTLRLVGFIGLGLGGAGLVLGAITGGLAIGKHGDLSDSCIDGSCPPDQQDNLDSYETMGTMSTIGFIAGGVLAATGLVLVLVAPSGDGDGADQASSPVLTTTVGLGQLSATLRF
ncbi:MAG: hypothetical protein DRI90_17310 [Deltaproteobacteria bacterium]|nr:MAG: hypothetical protein DRI90_17310 [Deltaproteobacteria bacterium]